MLTETEIQRLAHLAHLEMTPEATGPTLEALNRILGLIEQLQAVNTEGIEPLAHPLSAIGDVTLRLRDDTVTEAGSVEQREQLMASAPATADGLFLVPRVIE